jgi:hypothetical protein
MTCPAATGSASNAVRIASRSRFGLVPDAGHMRHIPSHPLRRLSRRAGRQRAGARGRPQISGTGGGCPAQARAAVKPLQAVEPILYRLAAHHCVAKLRMLRDDFERRKFGYICNRAPDVMAAILPSAAHRNSRSAWRAASTTRWSSARERVNDGPRSTSLSLSRPSIQTDGEKS